MKGVTKIQLFDAKTHELIHEQVEENLVTNAISKLFSMTSDIEYAKPNVYNDKNPLYYNVRDKTPFSEKLLGGVLLFSSAIAENANTVYPPMGTTALGNAGAAYSGSVPSRGSYNINESRQITDGSGNPIGYRYVWDFGTDKCNGTVACVCMTSKRGGNTGWTGVIEAHNSSEASPLFGVACFEDRAFYGASSFQTLNDATNSKVISAPIISAADYYSGKILFIDETNHEIYLAMRRTSASGVAICKVSAPTSFSLGTGHKFSSKVSGNASNLPTLEGIDKITPLVNTFSGYSFYNTYYYNGKIHSLYPATTTSVVHNIYNLDGTLSSTTTITLASALYGSGADAAFPLYFFNGNYYGLLAGATTTSSNFGQFDNTGALVSQIPFHSTPSGTESLSTEVVGWSVSYSNALNSIVLSNSRRLYDSSSLYMYNSMVMYGSKFLKANFACMNTWSKYYPFAPCACGGSSRIADYGYFECEDMLTYPVSPVILMAYPYLATINNLASPITKTSLNTMKVIYEIYDAS